jgi:hypothetical protein
VCYKLSNFCWLFGIIIQFYKYLKTQIRKIYYGTAYSEILSILWSLTSFSNSAFCFATKATFSVPVEKCDLHPKKECHDISSMVPSLQPIEKCIGIPKEVCTKVTVPRLLTKVTKRLFCSEVTDPVRGNTKGKIISKQYKFMLISTFL